VQEDNELKTINKTNTDHNGWPKRIHTPMYSADSAIFVC